MNRAGEAVKAQFDNLKAAAALGGVTLTALVAGGSLAPSAEAAHTKGGKQGTAAISQTAKLKQLQPLEESTIVQLVEQKPVAFYNGEVILHERNRLYAGKGICVDPHGRCVNSIVENFTVSFYNPYIIPRTKSANLNDLTSGDFAIGTSHEETIPASSGDINAAIPTDKPNVTLYVTDVGAIVDPRTPSSSYRLASSATKLTGVELSPTDVTQPAIEYVTYPLDGNGGLTYDMPTNPLTGQAYQDPSTPGYPLAVADDNYIH
jgi:hypothetical protein